MSARLQLGALLLSALASAGHASADALPLMSAAGADDRVLVVAPHPDDESLCCAGFLQRARAAGAAIGIVWVTAGDGFALDAMLTQHSIWPREANLRQLGAQRLIEARRAAAALGVPSTHQYVLGYPDRGVSALLGEFYSRSYRSPYTGLSMVVYPQARSAYASYTGANLSADLRRVLEEFQPTLVLAAAPQDQHPDHAASGALVRALLQSRGELTHLRYWIVHAPRWPSPRGYHPQLPLLPPADAAALAWQLFPLNDAERATKLAALHAHRTQMRVMASYLDSFVRADELFALPGS